MQVGLIMWMIAQINVTTLSILMMRIYHTRGTSELEVEGQGVEMRNIAKFLTLPLIPVPTTRRIITSIPIIDYSKSWIITNDEYLTKQGEVDR